MATRAQAVTAENVTSSSSVGSGLGLGSGGVSNSSSASARRRLHAVTTPIMGEEWFEIEIRGEGGSRVYEDPVRLGAERRRLLSSSAASSVVDERGEMVDLGEWMHREDGPSLEDAVESM